MSGDATLNANPPANPATSTNQGEGSQNGDGQSTDQPPAWAQTLIDNVNGRLSKITDDVVSLRKRVKGSQTPPSSKKTSSGDDQTGRDAPPSEPSSTSGLSWADQRELMRLESTLSKESLEWLDEQAEGKPLSTRKLLVEALAKGQSGTQDQPPVSLGGTPLTNGSRGGTPPAKRSSPIVTTRKQYEALTAEERRKVTDDPSFNYRNLK